MIAKTERHTTTLNVIPTRAAPAGKPLVLVGVNLLRRVADQLMVATDVRLPEPRDQAEVYSLATTAGSTDVMVVPVERYNAMMDSIEDMEAAIAFKSTRGEESFPAEVADRLSAGESPICVFRKYRGMTQHALADKIGKTKGYISEIEAGKKPGSVGVIRGIAEALGVAIDDLV